MRFTSKAGWLLALSGVAILAFCLGRISARSPETVSSADVSPGERDLIPPSKPMAPPPSRDPRRPGAASADDWEIRWRRVTALPGSRLREQEIIAALEELATRDPQRALALAQAEANLRLRLEMYRAALRGWAKVAPEAAADWALSSQTAIERGDAISAVMTGAASNPEAALKLTAQLVQKDPEHARDHGVALIAALGGAGEFERAARFAATGDQDSRDDWMTTAYSLWADYQPAAALAALATVTDPQAKRNAFNAVMTSWAGNDPQAVAEYAGGLASGEDKKFAITVALQNWAANDAVAAADWMRHREPSPELDSGAASVAVDPDSVRQPAVAVDWAESIVDPQLRSSTLTTIIRQWRESDPAAARRYAESSAYLLASDRSEALADLSASDTR